MYKYELSINDETMKIKYTITALATMTMAANAALSTLSLTPGDNNLDQTSALNNGGNTVYFYGFDVAPTASTTDLDGVSAGAIGDFHTSAEPTYDHINGTAGGTGGSDAILRGDFNNSLWRTNFNATDSSYSIEARVTISGGATAGSFGLLSGNSAGEGFNNLIVNGAGTNFDASLDLANQGLDNTGAHVWRFVSEDTGSGRENWVFRDGVLLNSTAIDGTTGGSANNMWFGDWGSSFTEGYTMDYFSISEGAFAPVAVPEPSSTALLGLGGLALLMRRRK